MVAAKKANAIKYNDIIKRIACNEITLELIVEKNEPKNIQTGPMLNIIINKDAIFHNGSSTVTKRVIPRINVANHIVTRIVSIDDKSCSCLNSLISLRTSLIKIDLFFL